jgi:hypothetical protein
MPGTLASIVIGLFGALGWLLAIVVTIQRVRLLTRGVRTTGTIKRATIRSELRSGSVRRTTQSAVVQVRDEATGETFEFQSSFGTSVSRVEVGKKVPVRYLPYDHSAAEIDRFLPMWFFPLGAAVVGTLLLWSLWYLKLRAR